MYHHISASVNVRMRAFGAQSYTAYPSVVEPDSPSDRWRHEHLGGVHRSRTLNRGGPIATRAAEMVHSTVGPHCSRQSAYVSLIQSIDDACFAAGLYSVAYCW